MAWPLQRARGDIHGRVIAGLAQDGRAVAVTIARSDWRPWTRMLAELLPYVSVEMRYVARAS